MLLENLIKEMAAKKVTNEMIAQTIGVHRNTVTNRINGNGSFSIKDAIVIQKTFFPQNKIEYLFAQNEQAKQ